MRFLEALYGSQYSEISQQGKDGNKGRLNANLFLSAFIILIILDGILLLLLMPGVGESLNKLLPSIFGNGNGKAMGKLLAIPLLAVIYLSVSKTVGSEENFKKHVNKFVQWPDEEKKKANKKLLVPFMVLLAVLLVTSLSYLQPIVILG